MPLVACGILPPVLLVSIGNLDDPVSWFGAMRIPRLALITALIGPLGLILSTPLGRLEICQKIYTSGFSGQKFYPLKEEQHKCINISYFSRLFVRI